MKTTNKSPTEKELDEYYYRSLVTSEQKKYKQNYRIQLTINFQENGRR